ncbi:hypothetical protein MNBD_GAMMA23-919 [hydrothermal vent metagenome]|uniref:PilZ domain-containing protein n=1 Tax=hydrothermal vent metagenome TaxID=652676 RepID=A0A3B1A046_9ZZZZ
MAEENNSIISDPVHINAILTRLEKNHCQLDVEKIKRDNSTQSLGISEILHISHKKSTILLDAINHNNISSQQLIQIFSKHDGIEIKFHTRVTSLTKRNHLIYFNARIPSEIAYKQRRLQYRVELQNLWKIPVTLLDKNTSNPLTAYIYNISTGGINVRSSTDKLSQIKQDTVIDTLIQLPSTESIQCKLQVRQTKSDKTTGLQQLAGQFINLTPRQEKNIRAFVNSVDRTRIKTTEKHHAEYN